MATIVIKSTKLGIVVKEIDTEKFKDDPQRLLKRILRSIPDADWFEKKETQEKRR